MEYRTVSTRLSIDEFTLVTDYCKRKNTTPSALIKELIFEDLPPSFEEIIPSMPSYTAGKNILEYDKKRDSFSWYIELDTGKRVIILKSISAEYIGDLGGAIINAITSRNELQHRKKQNSVPIPKKLIKGGK